MQTESNPLTISFKEQHNKRTVRQKGSPQKKTKDYLQEDWAAWSRWQVRQEGCSQPSSIGNIREWAWRLHTGSSAALSICHRSHRDYKCVPQCLVWSSAMAPQKKTSNLTSPASTQELNGSPPLNSCPRISLLVQGGGWNSGPLACWTSTLPLSYIPSPAFLFQCLAENC